MSLCLIQGCTRPATDRDLCQPHAHYFRVVLSDKRYRTEPCPPAPPKRGAYQPPLKETP